jgi:hypothetical protein
LPKVQNKYAALKQEINPPTVPILLSIYPNGYTQLIPSPTMVPSALSKIPPYKEITDVPSLIDMELEIVAQIELNDDNVILVIIQISMTIDHWYDQCILAMSNTVLIMG